MTITLDIEHVDAYIQVTPHGVYTRDEVFPVSHQVLDECRQHDLSGILIDTTDFDIDSISPSEKQFIGHHIAKTFPAARGIKIAFVASSDTQKQLFDAVAGQTEAKLSVFAAKDDALDWLLEPQNKK